MGDLRRMRKKMHSAQIVPVDGSGKPSSHAATVRKDRDCPGKKHCSTGILSLLANFGKGDAARWGGKASTDTFFRI